MTANSSKKTLRKVSLDDGTGTIEIALDVEWAHAIAPKANIVRVESASNATIDLLGGVNVAVQKVASICL